MSRRIRNMCAALEAYEELEPSMPIEEAEVGITTSDAEISEIQANIDAHEDAMNTLVEDQKTIDNLEAQVNQTVQSGEGTTEENAELVQVVVESIFRRHGLGRRNYPRVNLSNESFKTKADRVKVARKLAKNLRVSKEGIGQAIADVIAKICEFFRDLFKKLMGKSNYSSGSSSSAKDALNEAARESDDGKNTPVALTKTDLKRFLKAIEYIYANSIFKDDMKISNIVAPMSDFKTIPDIANSVFEYAISSCNEVLNSIKDRRNIVDKIYKLVNKIEKGDNTVEELKAELFSFEIKEAGNTGLIEYIRDRQSKQKEWATELNEAISGLYDDIDNNENDHFIFDEVTLKTMEELNTNASKARNTTYTLNNELNKFLGETNKLREVITETDNRLKAKQQPNSNSNENNESDLSTRINLCNDATQIAAAIANDTGKIAASVTNAIIDNETKVNNVIANVSKKITSNMRVWKSKNVGDDVTSIYEQLYPTCQKKCEQQGDKWVKVRK